MVEQLMLSELREICARYSTDELQITVFHPFFIYIDQYLAIMPQTLQTIFVTTAVMVVISLLLFQNIVCALVVFFSIVSIEIGVIGESLFLTTSDASRRGSNSWSDGRFSTTTDNTDYFYEHKTSYSM